MTQRTSGTPIRTGDEPLLAALLAVVLAVALMLGSAAVRGQEPLPQQTQDARIDGQLAAIYALNPHLNSADIDASVSNGVVHLGGTVPTEIERELAAELARSVKGVTAVRNDLGVAGAPAVPPTRSAQRESSASEREHLRRSVADASISAVVRSKLSANQNTKDLQIAVETQDNVVTLTGEVRSAEERELAELLVRNAQNVKDVRNELKIRADRAARY